MSTGTATQTDVVVVGAGLAGLVAADQIVRAGKRVTVVDQENAHNIGGQAYWSFGGLFLVDSPEQRRLRIKDSFELAWNDWQGSAGWDRLDGELPEDEWAAKWGRAYVEFAAGEKRPWLVEHGVQFTPVVGWAERGDGTAGGHGNSVPRFHVPWGTGTGISEPWADRACDNARAGKLEFRHRHRVDRLIVEDGAVVGVAGSVLAPDDSPRGVTSNRDVVGDFELRAQAVVVASGGIGANHDLVRQYWPARLGTAPRHMVTGVPAHVDGRMIAITESAGARVVNKDRMWHYTEGVQNWDPIWPGHGIRILPGPSPLWLDALGRRLPPPGLPGYDTLGTLKMLRTTPDIAEYEHSWFIVTRKIIEKEFALSGSEQNPDITGRDRTLMLRSRLAPGVPAPTQAFMDHGADFVVADSVPELVAKMNALTDTPLLDADAVLQVIKERDSQLDNPFCKDVQIMGIHNARRSLGDKIVRTATPHRLLDRDAGPLIGVRLHVLTRKTLGGIQTDLSGRALRPDGTPMPGLYAAGEAAGFGGGGVHGYNALEGTFLGGCLFTGLTVGRSIGAAL